MKLTLLFVSCILLTANDAFAVLNPVDMQAIQRSNSVSEVRRASTYGPDFSSTIEEPKARFYIGLSSFNKDISTPSLQTAYRVFGNFLITSSYNFTADDFQAGFMMGF